MRPSPLLTSLAGAGIALAVVIPPGMASPASPAAPAQSDRGLFGAQDPTYDGVYRQGFAILGLTATTGRAPRSAVTWLLRQQCADGSFQAYRASATGSCDPVDPINYTGPDSNSTALAAMALFSSGQVRQARAATRYLLRIRNTATDGGFPYYAGQASDANSTGLSLAAVGAVLPNRSAGSARAVRRLQVKCTAQRPVQRGFFSYTATPAVPDSLATAQMVWGLTARFGTDRPALPRYTCPAKPLTTRTRTATALRAVRAVLNRNRGLLPAATGTDGDASATAQAVLPLARVRPDDRAVATAVRALRRQAPTFGQAEGSAAPAALGQLLLVADATGADPRRFGNVDLLASLRASRR